MERIAKFEKVSEGMFLDALEELGIPIYAGDVAYNNLELPTRATSGSAGYDFHTPLCIHLDPGQSVIIPTGVRCRMNPGWMLMLVPKSGLGFKFRLMMDNTVGIIDSDYYFSDNEGQMRIKMTNFGDKVIDLNENAKIAQGIFIPYGITEDDNAVGKRNGGFGSTGE